MHTRKSMIRTFALVVVLALMTACSTAYAADQVNVNTASESELEALPGVGSKYAAKIIANRPYSSADDLSKAGLSKRKISKLTPMVTFQGGAAAAPAAAASVESKAAATAPSTERPAASSKSSHREASELAATGAQTPPQPGMVWANSKTKVYHTAGDRYYGKTKSGKWMTEADALKEGYRKDKMDK